MGNEQRRMSKGARAELLAAIESGSIVSATEYAQKFAARHGLNPETVRSTISRMRRDLGLLERPQTDWLARRQLGAGPAGRANPAAGEPRPGIAPDERVNAVTLLTLPQVADTRLLRLAAAALLRYEEDEEFRQAVDDQRPHVQEIYSLLRGLRESAEDLSPEERDEVLRFLAPE
jgi:hypothetical protein